ncbi:MAG: hypothetical protein IKB74_01395, partial [Lentisphaeria bacterium]|nr:hypothetical protein [Lentisphaeria bacterium]
NKITIDSLAELYGVVTAEGGGALIGFVLDDASNDSDHVSYTVAGYDANDPLLKDTKVISVNMGYAEDGIYKLIRYGADSYNNGDKVVDMKETLSALTFYYYFRGEQAYNPSGLTGSEPIKVGDTVNINYNGTVITVKSDLLSSFTKVKGNYVWQEYENAAEGERKGDFVAGAGDFIKDGDYFINVNTGEVYDVNFNKQTSALKWKGTHIRHNLKDQYVKIGGQNSKGSYRWDWYYNEFVFGEGDFVKDEKGNFVNVTTGETRDAANNVLSAGLQGGYVKNPDGSYTLATSGVAGSYVKLADNYIEIKANNSPDEYVGGNYNYNAGSGFILAGSEYNKMTNAAGQDFVTARNAGDYVKDESGNFIKVGSVGDFVKCEGSNDYVRVGAAGKGNFIRTDNGYVNVKDRKGNYNLINGAMVEAITGDGQWQGQYLYDADTGFYIYVGSSEDNFGKVYDGTGEVVSMFEDTGYIGGYYYSSSTGRYIRVTSAIGDHIAVTDNNGDTHYFQGLPSDKQAFFSDFSGSLNTTDFNLLTMSGTVGIYNTDGVELRYNVETGKFEGIVVGGTLCQVGYGNY